MRTTLSHTRLLLLLSLISTSALQAQGQEAFSIYCTSNLDGTGKCRKEDGDDAVNCLSIPGGVIACKDANKKKYECVQYGSITAKQTQFACEPDTDNSVSDELFEKSELKIPAEPDADQEVPTSSDSVPKAAKTEQPKNNQLSEPELINPFQITPKPEINDNEFQEAF